MQFDIHPKSETAPAEGVRRHLRALFTVPLTLHHLTPRGVRASRGISLDISEAGVGALVQSQLQVGDTVAIDIHLPDRMLRAVAIVRHSSSVNSGFEFLGLSAEERAHIVNIASPTAPRA